MRCWIVAALLCLAGVAQATEFQIAPNGRLRSTDSVRIALVDAPPNALIDISAERLSQNGVEWFGATARFRADANGRVDLDSRPSLGGAYTGVDAYGLFWAMGPATRPEGVEATPGQFRFTARIVNGAQIASRTATFSNGFEEVVETAAPFPKAFLMQPRTGRPRATLILLGGFEGGDIFARGIAPRLAASGYAVLGLPYWQVEGLPQTFEDIPVDRLKQAYDWIARQPGLDADKVGLVGVSKGGEFVLLASVLMPWVKAVVAYAPSDVVWEGWGSASPTGLRSSFSWGGKPLPFLAYDGLDQARDAAVGGAPFDLLGTMTRARRDPEALQAAVIHAEAYRGPMLLIAGEDDQICPCAEMSVAIARRRLAAGLPTEVRIYADAGHYVVGDGLAGAHASEEAGGTRPGNAFARRDGWRETLAFLDRTFAPD